MVALENIACRDRNVWNVTRLQPLPRKIAHDFPRTFVRQHPRQLGRQFRPQPALARQPKQLGVGQRGPEEIGQPGRQRVVIHLGIKPARPRRGSPLLAENKRRRREHGHHRLRNTRLERNFRPRIGRLRQCDQPIQRGRLGRAAEGARGKFAQKLPGVGAAADGIRRRLVRENLFVARWPHPMLLRQGPTDRHGVQLQPQLANLRPIRADRRDFKAQGVRARGPLAIEGELKFLPAFAHELLFEQHLTIGRKGQFAAVEIELIVHVALKRADIDEQLIFPRVRHRMCGRHRRRRIIGKVEHVAIGCRHRAPHRRQGGGAFFAEADPTGRGGRGGRRRRDGRQIHFRRLGQRRVHLGGRKIFPQNGVLRDHPGLHRHALRHD